MDLMAKEHMVAKLSAGAGKDAPWRIRSFFGKKQPLLCIGNGRMAKKRAVRAMTCMPSSRHRGMQGHPDSLHLHLQLHGLPLRVQRLLRG